MSRPPFNPTVVDLSPEQQAREREVYGDLAASVRRLMEASLRTTLDPEEVPGVTAALDALSERLEQDRIDGAYGVSVTRDGRVRAYGNAVVGIRNPVAVPLVIEQDTEQGRAWSSFHFNALYEGPPGYVHGGVLALVLDQIFGEAAAAAGTPGMTGTLTIRYRRPTPLGDCSAAAWVDHTEGIKTTVKGELRDAEDQVTVEAEGLFILPRWAREAIAEGGQRPIRFE